MPKIDVEALQPFIDQKYIGVQHHPTSDLHIYNYTQKAQFDRVWTPETTTCRGLIARGNSDIVARPFRKFWNWDEVVARGEQIPVEPFEVFNKADGSLGILYHDDDDNAKIATRGSFTSEQAIEGTRILEERYAHVPFRKDCTYLFEIIYPANRIVVDYGGLHDLLLLAVIETESGREIPYEIIVADNMGLLPIVERFDGVDDVDAIRALERDDKEGVVVRFASGYRVKVKWAEYVRLHRLVTGVTARTIWEVLRAGDKIGPLIERVPDEFHAWVQATAGNLCRTYERIEVAAVEAYRRVDALPTRKEQAMALQGDPYRGLVFSILDSKPYADSIWKMIKPAGERPFRVDE